MEIILAKSEFHIPEILKQDANDAFYSQDFKFKTYLKDLLEKMIVTYKDPEGLRNVPYTTIIQSSGFGKTKQIEALSKEWFVVYCNLNGENADSMPQQSKLSVFLTDDFFNQTENVIEARFESYYCFFFKKINQILTDKNREKKENYLTENENIDGIKSDILKNCEFYIEKETKSESESLKTRSKLIFQVKRLYLCSTRREPYSKDQMENKKMKNHSMC